MGDRQSVASDHGWVTASHWPVIKHKSIAVNFSIVVSTAKKIVPDHLEPPEGITAETLGSVSIQLTWRRPTGNVDSYIVRYIPIITKGKKAVADGKQEKTLLW